MGEGLRINRRGPGQCGLLRKSVLLQMFAGGLGGVIRAWPGALQHICSSAVSGFTQHMALGWVCIRAGRSFPAHEKALLQRQQLYFHWAGGGGGEGRRGE